MSNLDNQLRRVNLRIICILIMQNQYRVYTSDGGFIDYVGYDRLPESLKEWLSARNAFDYIIPSAMFVSGVKVV